MNDSSSRAIAIVGVGAILPDAPDAHTFWENIKNRNNIFKNAKKFTTTIQKPMIEIILRICLAYQEM